MSLHELIEIKVIPDVDQWKLVLTTRNSWFAIIFHRGDDLTQVVHRLLALAKKVENALPDSSVGLTLREAAPPIREAVCDCSTHHNAQEVEINHCFSCGKPLHS